MVFCVCSARPAPPRKRKPGSDALEDGLSSSRYVSKLGYLPRSLCVGFSVSFFLSCSLSAPLSVSLSICRSLCLSLSFSSRPSPSLPVSLSASLCVFLSAKCMFSLVMSLRLGAPLRCTNEDVFFDRIFYFGHYCSFSCVSVYFHYRRVLPSQIVSALLVFVILLPVLLFVAEKRRYKRQQGFNQREKEQRVREPQA